MEYKFGDLVTVKNKEGSYIYITEFTNDDPTPRSQVINEYGFTEIIAPIEIEGLLERKQLDSPMFEIKNLNSEDVLKILPLIFKHKNPGFEHVWFLNPKLTYSVRVEEESS